jgi:hypothetical protein
MSRLFMKKTIAWNNCKVPLQFVDQLLHNPRCQLKCMINCASYYRVLVELFFLIDKWVENSTVGSQKEKGQCQTQSILPLRRACIEYRKESYNYTRVLE